MAARVADGIAVMYAGRIAMSYLLEVRRLQKTYLRGGELFANQANGEKFVAVDDVSFEVAPGEIFAIVGESGCGKSTLALLLLRLIEPDYGVILFDEQDLLRFSPEVLRQQRRKMQMIFQDPFACLDPRMRGGEIVAEPPAIHEPRLTRAQRLASAGEILSRVGLDQSALQRYPHEFSGGQRQRFGIARALILCPKLIVADQPVSALDVSVGAQVLKLLPDLQREFGLTYLFISHSLPVVAQLASHIAVMRAGQFVEYGPANLILYQPTHAYTRELLAAVAEIPRPAQL